MVSNPLTHLTHPTTTQMQVIISVQQQNNHLFNNHMQKTNTPIIQKQNLFQRVSIIYISTYIPILQNLPQLKYDSWQYSE
jgi:hypothetical protein